MWPADWLIPPQLFAGPADGDWSSVAQAQLAAAGEAPFDLPPLTRPSRAALQVQTPAVQQAQALEAALRGELKTTPARAVAQAFQEGQGLILAPWPYDCQRDERLVSFAPVLRRLAVGHYVVGEPAGEEFRSRGDAEAYASARQWYLKCREREIHQTRERARHLLQKWEAADPLLVTILHRLLARDRLLLDEHGAARCWQSGPHGRWFADGGAWRYGIGGTESGAIACYLLALQEAQVRPARIAVAEIEALLAPPGWRQQSGVVYEWAGGLLRGGVLYIGEERVGTVILTALGDNRMEIAVQGNRRQAVLPATQVVAPSEMVACLWAIGQVLEKLGGRC